MKNKIFASLALSVLALVLLTSVVSAAAVATWDFNATSTTPVAISYNTNLDVSSISAGAGIVPGTFGYTVNGITAATNTGAGNGWEETSLAAAVTDADYYEVSITAKTGYNFLVNSVSFNHLTTDTAMDFAVRSSEDTYVSNLSTGTSSTTSATATVSPLKLTVAEGQTFTLRIYGYNAAADTDDFTIDNLVISGDVVPEEVITALDTNPDTNDQLVLESLDLSVESGQGDDNEWYLLDTVNIETNVEYKGGTDYEMQNIEVKWGLFDRTTGEWIFDDEGEDFDLEGGEDQDVNLQLRLNEDVDKLTSGDIVVYVITTGQDEEYNDVETSEYVEADVTIVEPDDDQAVVVDVDALPQPIEALCGQEVTLTADVWNIRGEDFDDDQVKVVLTNTALGLNLEQIIDVGAGDNSPVIFTFRVPANANEKTYTLNLQTYYDYDEDDEDYNEVSEDEFPVLLKVAGGCVFDAKLTVTATLDSGGKAGEEMVVKASVTNTDSASRTFTVNASGFDAWAELVEVSPATLTLAAGETKEVTVTLLPNADVSGEQDFSIDLTDANGKVIPQPVSVLVEKAGFSLFTGNVFGGNNWYLWGIGALNIVLILIIILVAVRLVKK